MTESNATQVVPPVTEEQVSQPKTNKIYNHPGLGPQKAPSTNYPYYPTPSPVNHNVVNQLLSELRKAQEVVKIHYYLVIEQEAEHTQVEEFETKDLLVSKLRSLCKAAPRGMRVFVFAGDRLFLSKGSLKYLLLPNGDKEPLFDLPNTLEKDTDGNITHVEETKPIVNPLENQVTDAEIVEEEREDDLDDLDSEDFSEEWPENP